MSLLEIEDERAHRRGRPLVYVVLSGRGLLRVQGCDGESALEPWETWLLPADVANHHIAAQDSALRLLVAELPGGGN